MLVQFHHLPPNSYQDHKSESSTHYPHLASRAAGFFKAHYHQEPDPTNSLLNICGYGGLVRFKKENPHYGGLRENGRQETALTASCLICSCLMSRTNHVTNHCILDLFFPISTNS
ncbi:hypothetical protein DEC12_22020 [Salmonella enterica]|nr:hypothetical protein [Salmonella enterica]